MIPKSGNQFEFWRTYNPSRYPPGQLYQSTSGGPLINQVTSKVSEIDFPYNRYYVRKLTDVSFTEAVGLQALSYTELDIYTYAFTVSIEMQPMEGSVVLCKWIDKQLFIVGTEDRNDGVYSTF